MGSDGCIKSRGQKCFDTAEGISAAGGEAGRVITVPCISNLLLRQRKWGWGQLGNLREGKWRGSGWALGTLALGRRFRVAVR